ncbi:hypothetical protein GCM10007862_07040 [Dyella lipolytica]|uniref:Uncharacterized protein n=1 Tax=Dyella lipolytica TaxID=1867835 RepID=A0ABW8IYX8_9GAMM|nr:hypothetical protein [Dyella lipolytica]GLQ45653.1 hypothetical protein GCM10007862_07040 [Dyella lipolytica]
MTSSMQQFRDQKLANAGGGSNDGDMEKRLTTLETRLDTILPTLATKSDMEGIRGDISKTDTALTRWMLGTVIALLFGFASLIFAGGSLLNSNLSGIKSDVQRAIDLAATKQAGAPPANSQHVAAIDAAASNTVTIQGSPQAVQAMFQAKSEKKDSKVH